MMQSDMADRDPDTKAAFHWKKTEGQTAWIKVGLVFLAFYAGEAVLFWQGLALAAPLLRLPLAVPLVYPLGYWALFGFAVYRIQSRNPAARTLPTAEKRFLRWQRGLLTLVITVGVVGATFLVMRGSGSITLGHVTLFLVLFQAAAVIGAMDLNIGWLAAAGIWLLTALAIYSYPATLHLFRPFKDEDLLVGLGVSLGFVLIGVFPQRVDRERLGTCSEKGPGKRG